MTKALQLIKAPANQQQAIKSNSNGRVLLCAFVVPFWPCMLRSPFFFLKGPDDITPSGYGREAFGVRGPFRMPALWLQRGR